VSELKLGKSVFGFIPALQWSRDYDRAILGSDLMAALIVTIMLIPQSLAYAMLAGLPPQAGIYASILPIILYAIFGTSKTLAVGPVAIASLMTATAIGGIAQSGTPDYTTAALTLAFLSGILLLAFGIFRLGFLANFLSHPVVAGFITASGIIIAASQLKHILGVSAEGETLLPLLASLIEHLPDTNWVAVITGIGSIVFLFWVRKGMRPLLMRFGLGESTSGVLVKTGPVLAVAATTLAAWWFDLAALGLKTVGEVPQSLPPLTVPSFSQDLWLQLIGSAALISVIGFVESISVGQTLAAKKRERVDPDQELIGLGAANIGASVTGGFPVTGGFSRSVVNFDAGAETPAAGVYTAIGLAIAALFLTPLVFYLPNATLAATIIVAVVSLIDFSILPKTWNYSKADFIAVLSTIVLTLFLGIEAGVLSGVLISIAIHLFKTSRPHIAIVGQVPGTEHYRNVHRHDVITHPHVLSMRVDESLYFANARFLEDRIYQEVTDNPEIRHVVLMCSAVNEIDMSALESLEAINIRLASMDVSFNLSEVKGPVTDHLNRTGFANHLNGKIFLSQHQAVCELIADSG